MKSLEQNPDFQKRMEKFWNDLQSKLSPQDLKKFEQNILAAGVVQEEKNLNEDSFNKAFDIVQDKIKTLTEYSTINTGDYDDAPDYGIDKADNKAEYIAGKALSLIGGAGQTIVLPGLVAALNGFGFASPGMAAAMIGGILGGTVLRWLGDKLKTRSFSTPEKRKVSKSNEDEFRKQIMADLEREKREKRESEKVTSYKDYQK
jgi:hypothetical protein